MGNTRILRVLVSVGSLLVVSSAFPPTARAAWVNGAGTQFQVGGQLPGGAITPTLPVPNPSGFVNPSCLQGGTSLAVVSGSKLAGVDPVLYPVALVVSCLDNSDVTIRSRLNFINPITIPPPPALPVTVPAGTVVKQITTTAAPSNGWAHLVNRPDQGDLLGCGNNGGLYTIDYSQTTTAVDGTATLLTAPVISSCTGLAWDADADVIHVATTPNSIVRFKDGTTTLLGTFTAPCATTNGLAVSGGVLLVSCQGTPLTIHRLDKNTGASLGVHPTVTATGVGAVLPTDPGLGAFACDPVTFQKDATGKDLFTDALWSRRGTNGNGVVALEFPANTCGMPPSSVVTQAGVPYSPLAAGFGAPGTPASTQPGTVPRTGCFDANGQVIDVDRDGLPDCWETSGIDFAGTGAPADLLTLCVQVNTNGDGVTLTTECASPTHKDLFVEIDYMQDHKPDPKALSQTQSVATVGVKSVREAFAAAPVTNPDATIGIRVHMQVDEQVVFNPLSGPSTSHVDQVAFTPCTGPAANAVSQAQAVDFDTIKAGNFGTAAERGNVQKLNAKRLAFRYVVFAHNLVGNPGGGSNGSGCAEIGGDDAVVSLGSFAQTTVGNVSHRRGTTDQQAGTFMHEFGHTLGFGHGGGDSINCKPNYRSVMSYTRQFAGSPIPNRRLDYSRSADPVLPNPALSGLLNEGSLNEIVALGTHPSLGPIPTFFPSADQIVFGPNAWSLSQIPATAAPINWNRKTPTNETNASGNINAGATAGCDGSGTLLEGHDDWSNVLYRASAAVNFAGGETSPEMTSDNEEALFLEKDADVNGVGDGKDCGGTIPVPPDGTTSFSCTHRIDVPKGIKHTGNFEVVIFSEVNGTQVWNAPAQVRTGTLTFALQSVEIPVKVNNQGGGTCSAKDFADPVTGQKDGIKDLHCQFPGKDFVLPTGTNFGILSGFFFDPLTGDDRAFSARQVVTILP